MNRARPHLPMPTISPLLRSSAALLLALGAARPVLAVDEQSTVGSVARDNGLTEDGWFRIKTPSILRLEMSLEAPADIDTALTHYDRIVELPLTDPVLRAEAMRRAAYLRVQRADAGLGRPDDLARAIKLYEQLLAEQPTEPHNDRALYQLARAYQLNGNADASIRALQQLGDRFPQSALLGDGLFRAAELLFARGRYDQAASAYAKVMTQGPETRYFRQAEYKYGWSLYQQAQYPQAFAVFTRALDREFAPGTPATLDAALAGLPKPSEGGARDLLQAATLAAVGLGGGEALNAEFDRRGEPRYSPVLYRSVGDYLLRKQRYTDAAGVYVAYRKRHPQGELSPEFQALAIAAYRAGGFGDLVLAAKEDYARAYAPDSAYWAQRQPTPAMLATVREHFDDIARHYQALAQRTPETEAGSRQQRFLTAADWYQRSLRLFAPDARTPQTHMLYADALLDGGKAQQAAIEYGKAAYDYSANPKAAEAAFASVQVYQRLARDSSGAAHEDALKASVKAALQLADSMPAHVQRNAVLTQSAEDLLALNDATQAITVSERVLSAGSTPTAEQRRRSLSVQADARFALKQFDRAEAAYAQLVALVPAADAQRGALVERLAASIYKQAEAARDAGDLATAARQFLRVGQVTPGASIRANADYDAAVAFGTLKDWPSAQSTLEAFRVRYPQHALIGDVDKRLAYAYEQSQQWPAAASVYARIARRDGEAAATQRDAAWLSADYYDRSRQAVLGSQAYEYYLSRYPQPVDRALQAQRRLADIARDDLRDNGRYLHWLQNLVDTESAAGTARTPATQRMAAQASLEIGRDQAMQARRLALSVPVEKSLPAKLAATETAIATLARAARLGDADITTAATYELGSLYREFGRAILNSSRPANLAGDALEQYNILLEEQAFPFEEKAIQAYETNLARLGQGLWNDWIHRSARALSELAPAKYGKQEQRDAAYESLL